MWISRILINHQYEGSVTGHYKTNSLSQTDWTETFMVHIPEVNILYLNIFGAFAGRKYLRA